jgi:nicotinamide-nucleotide amidase
VALGLAGTAPAVLLEHEGRVVVLLPGPPGELRRLWPRAVAHEAFQRLLARRAERTQRLLRFFGPSESAIARTLAEAGGEGESVEATVCAHDLEIHVDLFFSKEGASRAEGLIDALRTAFPRELFALDDARPVAELVLAECRDLGLTLASAESATGGMVGARLTDIPGASDVYLGGVIAYADEAKERHLGIPAEILDAHGAVSAETATAMAAGARSRFGAAVAVADTGIAGPSGGSAEKPVGLVYLAIDSGRGSSTKRFVLPGDREAVRARATALVLHLLRRHLEAFRDSAV